MGNSSASKPLERQWNPKNLQTFMVRGHKNKIFGCDVIIPTKESNYELWIASCSADGKLLIHEVLIETIEQKHARKKILSQQTLTNLTKSKSLSSNSIQHKPQNNLTNSKKNKQLKPFEIEINRLLTIPLDSTYCYTLSLHSNCRYVLTCIDKLLLIFEIDFNAESPIYNRVQIAKKYISAAQFIDNMHVIFTSGDGNVYIYNFIRKQLISIIEYKNKTEQNNDILCFDHSILDLNKYNQSKKQIIVFGTLDGNILIYDITNIITNDIEQKDDKHNIKQSNAVLSTILIQKMMAQFGAEISCISMSTDGKFIVIGSEDNTYNIYYISLLINDDGNIENMKWILLCKQIVINDANISHVAWINNKTIIASCDKGKELYLSGIYDITDCEIIIEILNKYWMKINKECNIVKLYNKNNELYDIITYIIDDILQYVQWFTAHYKMNVDFEDKISCIATCQNINNGAGFIVVGGFSKLLQCFLPLQSIQ